MDKKIFSLKGHFTLQEELRLCMKKTSLRYYFNVILF